MTPSAPSLVIAAQAGIQSPVQNCPYFRGALMLYSYDTSIAVEKVAQKEIKRRTKGCAEMLGLESAAKLFLMLFLVAYMAGCGLIGQILAKRNDLKSLGPLGGFLVGVGFQIVGILVLIVWLMVRDDLKDKSR